jgi:hypothetical protein
VRGAFSFSTKNSGCFGSQAQACGTSIRWKAFRVEAGSSLYGEGISATLANGSSPTTSSKGGRVGASGGCASIRWSSRQSQDRRRKSGALVKAMRTTSSHRMEPVGGACKRQGMSEVGGFVVKALSAATTRGGSAWQASKDVLPTGARASKKSAGSVDGVVRKIDSRGSKARITHRRTEAGEANYLSKPSTTLMTRIMLGRSRWASLPTDDAQFAIRIPEAGKSNRTASGV